MNTKANGLIYGGIFLTSLATLMYEVLLTRIFSVTTWYHFAFLAISIAMLGMTLGAILVYLRPDKFDLEKTVRHQSISALLFGLSSIVAVMMHVCVPILLPLPPALIIPVSLFIALPLLLVAFTFSGISISLTLTRFPSQMHSLYAADFCGAALGCALLIISLQFLDGITDVFLAGALAALAAFMFAMATTERKLKVGTVSVSAFLALFVAVNGYLNWNQKPIIHLFWSKGEREHDVYFERWNCFSRVRVFGYKLQRPFEFGYSRLIPTDIKIKQQWLDMDGCAAAILYGFSGDLNEYSFFKYDVSNFAYDLIKDGNALVIGVGGGKDILAALALGEKSVTGVEINNNIIDMMTKYYGDFTGHLERNPKVKIVNDEARSFITRSKDKYDTIQATLVDTWAASSSGAYALTENSLYTVEAWKTFLQHLTDTGVLTVTRWYAKPIPAEIYRLTALAREALVEIGVTDPRNHIVLVRLMNSEMAEQLHAEDGLGTILVSRSAFTPEQLDRIEALCKELGFELALSPRGAIDPNLILAADGKQQELSEAVPFNVKPATDNRPFFFQTLSLKHLFDKRIYDYNGRTANNVTSAEALLMSLLSVVFFSIYCFRLPMLMTKDKSVLRGSLPLFVYFFCIGIGFMLIELSQVQRFSVFLGHPIYALSVVLFTLFLSTGCGSLCFAKLVSISGERMQSLIGGLLAISAIFGVVTPFMVQAFAAESTPMRIAIVVLSVFPLGFVLGLGFPTGMRFGFALNEKLTPWLWGINGAASVCGSVLSVVLSMFLGISFSYWFGFAFYILALVCVLKLNKGISASASPAGVPETIN